MPALFGKNNMGGLVQEQYLGADSRLSDFRRRGKAAFQNQGVPSAKTEAWKYTKPRLLDAEDYVLNFCETDSNYKPSLPFDGYIVCFENGILQQPLPKLPQGADIVSLADFSVRDEAKNYLGTTTIIEKQPFAALNQYYLTDGVCIRIAAGVKLDKRLVIVNHTQTTETNMFANIRNLFILEDGAEMSLVEYYNYSGVLKSRYLNNVVNEIFLEKDSVLRHYKVQDEAFKAGHIALNGVKVKQGGEYSSFTLQKGADISRNETRVMLEQEHAKTEVNAVYVMNGWATLDTTTDIEHLAPCTYSNQLVKGVVGGTAKGVFQGKIHIAPNAVQTEGYQLHKVLLLSDGAETDVKPELEIFADDVKCSHGAACGELDEEQLFYMQSRGISREDAEKLLIDAYLNDVVAKISDEKVTEWITLLIK